MLASSVNDCCKPTPKEQGSFDTSNQPVTR